MGHGSKRKPPIHRTRYVRPRCMAGDGDATAALDEITVEEMRLDHELAPVIYELATGRPIE